ncbi:hypothetical protein ACFGVR_12745 [Mucilaginibacter sp. AW1-3]
MTTTIEDNQLNTELQELYLVSKQWISDLTFFESEFNFLKKRFEETLNANDNMGELERIAAIQTKHKDFEFRIQNYLHRLEPFITEAKQPLNINLIETYAQIESELNQFASEIVAVKHAILQLTKEHHKKNA